MTKTLTYDTQAELNAALKRAALLGLTVLATTTEDYTATCDDEDALCGHHTYPAQKFTLTYQKEAP